MKRKWIAIAAVVLAVALLLVCCSKTSATSGAKVTLTFAFGKQDFVQVLPDEDAEKVIRILDGNAYSTDFFSVPSCGFSKDVTITVGRHSYAIACDTCNVILDMGNLHSFTISKEDMAYIHSLFEQYGGFFPCI